MNDTSFKGLTWDHPRGYNALAAAAKIAPVAIAWDKQPLEGFESHPIADLCARYDLVVLDHPHVGEALAGDCLQPLDTVFSADELAAIAKASIGPSTTSYIYEGRQWALPLDAATQVMACRADLLDADVPVTWAEVEALSESSGKVGMSLAGPHAFLSFLSICAALGEEPGRVDADRLVSDAIGQEAYGVLSRLAARSPAVIVGKNPIGILNHMQTADDVILVPLIYGYVNYAAPRSGHPILFQNAPCRTPGGRPGSTIGGTGIGISRRCVVTPDLKAHLLWLMSAEAQAGFIPDHDGQPSRRDAWHDSRVNAAWGDFYANTADTLEASYVRPRFDGYIALQTAGSAVLRAAMASALAAPAAVNELNTLYRTHRKAGAAV